MYLSCWKANRTLLLVIATLARWGSPSHRVKHHPPMVGLPLNIGMVLNHVTINLLVQEHIGKHDVPKSSRERFLQISNLVQLCPTDCEKSVPLPNVAETSPKKMLPHRPLPELRLWGVWNSKRKCRM